MDSHRVIVHVDMDAFFAAIEQRDSPALRGKPVVVGADPKGGHGRGVVSTCSYEARRFGIHSAQPISEAYRCCPDAVFVRGRMEVYEEVSGVVRRVLEEFSPDIEQVSIDEAFLDVTGSLHLFGDKRRLAEELRRRIEEQTGGLTASIGIAPNKLVAKMASDMRKPRGLVIVEPGEVEAFLWPLPVSKLWGVGEKTCQALSAIGVRTIGDMADKERDELARRFGKAGEDLWELAHGRDDRPVECEQETKSIGAEHTFERDTDDMRQVQNVLLELCDRVAARLREAGLRGRTVTTRVRFEDFATHTRAQTLDRLLDDGPALFDAARANMRRVAPKGRKVRLIGVSVSGLQQCDARQTDLFDRDARGTEISEKRRRLGEAMDRIRRRFGEDALRRGTSLRPGEDRKDKGARQGRRPAR